MGLKKRNCKKWMGTDMGKGRMKLDVDIGGRSRGTPRRRATIPQRGELRFALGVKSSEVLMSDVGAVGISAMSIVFESVEVSEKSQDNTGNVKVDWSSRSGMLG